ncbi:SDR family oxidoreductase [Sporomusa malonica]|uniref:UDP-N-acetylglucosamine 4-epimerase n=1 Tax=Sporomusa malonica TaxID=112901 RepID=A0A1W1YUH8_9FIRM|nr:SDR family oxidoreductase [Sporomusa malonica]SMC39481.1 UDP-N-acetylglucosamine 4-epimerase [Sporomusa malonica]
MSDIEYNFPENTKFLVTGGAGFIGSNLVEAILKLGFQVRVLDNFSTGKEENIKEFYQHPNFELHRGDLRSLDECQKACRGMNYVLHQAALGSVPRSIDDPITSNNVNVCGTLNILTAARDQMVKRFVFASSSSVYGDEPNLPKTEDRIGKPLSPYAITKRAKEMYARNFYEIYGLPTIGLRYFNVFGKKQDSTSAYAAVIPKFVKALINNEAPIIHGDGRQSRDFTYIENVIQANLKACLVGAEAFGEVFNIAFGGREYLIDLYHKIASLLEKDIEPSYGPSRAGDVKHSNADITKARKILNYNPQYDLISGLEMAIDWYRENI